ncbi:MAG: carboxypeptidase regulatory-like domain-containing protein [Opitutaceae bacterium]|nr:carboxypeptidase regulatory-like domain-containing protein [Opitutaceae bacterium]
MRTPLPHSLRTAALIAFAALFFLLVPVPNAAAADTGQIEGRVLNAATGAYLNNARVSIPGSDTLVYTDDAGRFIVRDVPPGPVTVRVTFSGFDSYETRILVNAGGTSNLEINLESRALFGDRDGSIKLEAFNVSSTRETSASAIAVNEQRVASNITSVVSADEFGTLVDSNPGEFLKYLPGIDVEYFANNITGVSVRGLGANNTEMNFDGMSVASMNAEGVGRKTEVQFTTMADIARAEIRKLPLPEDSANSIGGSINLIRRSAFEYKNRVIRYQALLRSDGERLTTDAMAGPKDRRQPRWRPNWQVSWTEPLTRNFGFALTLGQEDTVVNTHWAVPAWNYGSVASDTAAAAAIAAGQPVPNLPSNYNPALTNALNHNAPIQQGKDYASLRLDWRPWPELTLGWSLSGTQAWKQVADDIRYRWNLAATGSGDPVRYNDQYKTLGRLGGAFARQESPLWRDIYNPAISTVLDARWKRGRWEASARTGWSISRYQYYDTEHGFFNSTSVAGSTGLVEVPETGVGFGTANPISLTMNIEQNYWGPQRIEAWTTATGAASTQLSDYNRAVDWGDLNVARIGGARSRPGSSKEIVMPVKLFVKRHFNFSEPLSLQLGYDWSERYRNRRYDSHAWRFVGADGVPNSADDAASLIAADHLPRGNDTYYGVPGTARISMSKLYDLYRAHPNWFRYDVERSARLTLTQNSAYDLTERISAPYVQFDTQLFRHRLRLTGGVRYEATTASARGLLVNNSAAYMKYADGSTVRVNDRDSGGNLLVVNRGTNTAVDYQLVYGSGVLPATRAGNPVFIPQIQAAGNADRRDGKTADTATNLGRSTLAFTQAVYRAKGATNDSENDGFFPSLHGTWNFTDSIVLQAGYARTQGRIDYADALIPNNTVSDNLVTTGDGIGARGQITVQNPSLEPWTADNFEARISHYTRSGGLVGFGLFRKNVSNFQPEVDSPPMTAEDVAAAAARFPDAGIGPEFEGYSLRTKLNSGSARLEGAELELRQNLNAILPGWARGFVVSGAISYLNRKGLNGNELGANRAWTNSANLNYRNRNFSGRVGYRMNGEQIETSTIESNGLSGRRVREAQHLIDVSFEYSVTRWAKVFLSGQNLLNDLKVSEQRFPYRPGYASLVTSNTLGRTITLGVTGEFGDRPFRWPWSR